MKTIQQLNDRSRSSLFALLVVGLALALLLLPRPLAAWLLLALLALGVGLAGRAAVGGLARMLRARLDTWPLARRLAWARLLNLGAGGLAALAAYLIRPGSDDVVVNQGLALWLLLLALMGLAAGLARAPALAYPRRAGAAAHDIRRVPLRWRWLSLGLGAFALLTLASTATLPLSYHLQFGLLLAGCGGLAAGLGAHLPGRQSGRGGIFWLLAGLTLLAFALNLNGIENRVHIWIDEFHFAEMVVRLWDDPNRPLLAPNPGIAAFPYIFGYFQMLAVAALGPELIALRVVSVVFGALTIPALYLLARELLDRRTALLAALFLLTFPPHIHFSRLGINNIADPLFGVLALAFLMRGLRHGRRGDYALSGIMLGLTQYFYEGGKLLYPPLLLAWGGLALVVWRPRGGWRGLLLLIGAAGVVALPVYAAALTSGALLAPRLERMNVLEYYFDPRTTSDLLTFVETHYRRPLLHFIHLPDTSIFFFGGQTGLLLPALVPFFLLGLGVALWRLRLAGALLVLWLGATVVGNSLIGQWVFSARYVVAFPLIALLLALGLRFAWGLLPLPAGRLRLVTGAALAASLMLAQVGYYFGPHLAYYNQQVRPYHDHIDMMYRTRDFPLSTRVILIHTPKNDVFFDHFRVLEQFWKLPPRVYVAVAGEDTYAWLNRMPRHVDLAFFIEEDDYATLQELHRRYTLPVRQYSPYNVPRDRQYILYYIPADPAQIITE